MLIQGTTWCRTLYFIIGSGFFLLVLHATPDSLGLDNWGTDVGVGILLLSGETLLQVVGGTQTQVHAGSIAIAANAVNHSATQPLNQFSKNAGSV